MNKNYEVKAIQRVMLKAVDGSTTVHLEDCTVDDGVKQIHTFPTFALNLCDSEFKNPPQRFINFIVSYLQSLVGKDVYVVHYLPLRKGMEDVDVYQGTVKNRYTIIRLDSGLIVTINVHIGVWNLDTSCSPIAIFETKQEAEKFADYLRSLKGSMLGVVASEVTTVVGDGCETKRYLMPSYVMTEDIKEACDVAKAAWKTRYNK